MRLSSSLKSLLLISACAVEFCATARASAPEQTPAPVARRSDGRRIQGGMRVARQATTSPPAAESTPLFTAVSDCHVHETVQFCMAGTQEYEVLATSTATEELPATYTGCHQHDAEIFCVDPNGDDVQLVAEGQEEEHDKHDHNESNPQPHDEHGEGESESATGGENCHFHGGIEHCTGGSHESESAPDCSRPDREYNVRLRVGLLFVVLVTSTLGVFGPILLASFSQSRFITNLLLILKQFGTGVMISTAFIHLYTHAQLMFANECLTNIEYESTTSAIVIAGIFISFVVDVVSHRLVAWRNSKKVAAARSSAADKVSDESPARETVAAASRDDHTPSDVVGVALLEAGIIFHSLLIGLTLVVAGDSFFLTLFAVIVFHQFFEGVALGTCIAQLPRPSNPPTGAGVSMAKKLLMAGAFAVITPLGMGIGIGVLDRFNGNDPATIIAIGTLDALSAGILAWVALVEMLAADWLGMGGKKGALAESASPAKMGLAGLSLVAGLVLMSLLGKWA